jgi:xanthine dehydrogenase molybdenum-binding subunit
MSLKDNSELSLIRFRLNGREVEILCDSSRTTLEVLRDDLKIVSPKDGCSSQGTCGCCTILVDGKPTMSCTKPISSMEGADITTLEGIAPHKRDVLVHAFSETGAVQCGFCTPGISIRVAALLDKIEQPEERQIRNALQAHLCRCTGYIKIFAAVREAAKYWRSDELPLPSTSSGVGQSALRYLAREAVLGEKVYIDDMNVPDMLYATVVLSEYPRARILRIDTEAALAMSGVEAIMTARDLPAARKCGLIIDDWPVMISEGDWAHCVGSVIAVVAAHTRQQARRAADHIQIEYEPHPPLTDPQIALQSDAPKVHQERDNLLARCHIQRGEIDHALAQSANIISEVFTTQRVEHAFLEPEAALAVPQDDGILIYTQGQGVFDDQRQIAHILGLPLTKVRIQLVSSGGAFGGKEDLSIQAHAALLALHTRRPVKLTLTRQQSIALHPKRHPLYMEYTVGCDSHGKLTAVKAKLIGDTGAYASVGEKVMERAAGHACGPYHVPNVDIEALTVYTNNPPSGAFRGFGVNQAAFAIEGILDRLAHKLGIDRYQIRDRNLLQPGDAFATGQIMDESSIGLRKCLEAVKAAYQDATYTGIACGIKNTGIGNGLLDIGRVLLHIDSPQQLTLYTGYTEMGQGLFTVLRQIVCHETGLKPSQIRVEVNTDYAVECGMTTASRATTLAGEAARRAALKLKAALHDTSDLAPLVGQDFAGEYICDFTTKPDAPHRNPITHLSFGYAAQVAILDQDGKLQKIVAAHDVGKVMNPTLCEGQIEGAVLMGIGFALTEDLPCPNAIPASTKLNDLGLIRAKFVPDIQVILLEINDPIGPYGAKGVGEIGLVPTAAAIASALYSFDGVFRSQLPMLNSTAARAIHRTSPKS